MEAAQGHESEVSAAMQVHETPLFTGNTNPRAPQVPANDQQFQNAQDVPQQAPAAPDMPPQLHQPQLAAPAPIPPQLDIFGGSGGALVPSGAAGMMGGGAGGPGGGGMFYPPPSRMQFRLPAVLGRSDEPQVSPPSHRSHLDIP